MNVSKTDYPRKLTPTKLNDSIVCPRSTWFIYMYSVFRVHIVKLGEWRPKNLHVRGRSDCMLLLVIDVQSVQYKQSRKDLKKKQQLAIMHAVPVQYLDFPFRSHNFMWYIFFYIVHNHCNSKTLVTNFLTNIID